MNMKTMKILALIEVLLLITVVLMDMLIPSLVIIFIGGLFLIIRREKAPLFEKIVWKYPLRFIGLTLGLGLALTVFNFCLVIPVLSHLTHSTQNMNIFADLKGNESLLIILLAYSWIIAAIGEEFAYRGFFQNRIISMFANQKVGTVIAVLGTSALFGFMHMEQGIVGVINTALDAIVYSIIRYKMRNIWASVLVHGFSNMIGIVTFYFVGPLYGLW